MTGKAIVGLDPDKNTAHYGLWELYGVGVVDGWNR